MRRRTNVTIERSAAAHGQRHRLGPNGVYRRRGITAGVSRIGSNRSDLARDISCVADSGDILHGADGDLYARRLHRYRLRKQSVHVSMPRIAIHDQWFRSARTGPQGTSTIPDDVYRRRAHIRGVKPASIECVRARTVARLGRDSQSSHSVHDDPGRSIDPIRLLTRVADVE